MHTKPQPEVTETAQSDYARSLGALASAVESPPAVVREFAYSPNPALRFAATHNEAALADCKGKRIGILIVAYNAVATLAEVLHRISPEVWRNVEEIAVFDDASQDATYDLAMGLKTIRALTKLEVLTHPRNLGYGGNQKAGYRYFIEKGFDVVVLLHGDGQYAPEILSQIYRPIVDGEANAVLGSRMMKDFGGPLRGGMPFYKYVGNRILTAYENHSLGMKLTEFHSGYRAYDLRALSRVNLSRMTDDFHFDTEILIKLNHQRAVIKEVPIPTYYGSEICRVNGLAYAANVVRAVRRYRKTCRSVARFPEFEEFFVHYPAKESRYSSHDYAREMVGRDKDVLDLGCGEGFLAHELRAGGNRIVGADVVGQPAQAADLEEYLSADLNQGLETVVDWAARQPGGRRFDRVLLLDILEHLDDPGRILRQCCELLKSGGSVIVSLPNVANITVRLMLLFGHFDYTTRGILDETHKRFFTRKTARRLIAGCGYEIIEEHSTVMPVALALGIRPESRVMKVVNGVLMLLTKLMPGLFGYQLMFRVGPARKQ